MLKEEKFIANSHEFKSSLKIKKKEKVKKPSLLLLKNTFIFYSNFSTNINARDFAEDIASDQ